MEIKFSAIGAFIRTSESHTTLGQAFSLLSMGAPNGYVGDLGIECERKVGIFGTKWIASRDELL